MDRLDERRPLKSLTTVDEFTKESVEIALDHRIPNRRERSRSRRRRSDCRKAK
jgi:hypothetical protein